MVSVIVLCYYTKNMKIQAVIVSLLLLISFSLFHHPLSSLVYASEPVVTYESVNPDFELRYKLKRFAEKIEGMYINVFKNNQKASFLTKIAERRFSEYVYIIENNKANHLEVATSRYITHIGLLSEEVGRNKQENDIGSKFADNSEILSNLQNKFPAQTAEWLFLQQAIDTSDVFVSKVE